MKDLEEEFKETKFFKHWEHSTQGKVNINSGTQLAHFLYSTKKLKPAKLTETGRGSTDEEALEQLNIPELNILAQKNKLKKCKDTLEGFNREQVNGVLHPSYNLHLVVSYRSSSSGPNMQNTPKREEDAMKIVRRAIIPREGYQLMEVDFKGSEVSVNCAYNKDTNLIKYVCDPTTDMHRDMAKQLFFLKDFDKGHTVLRQAAKNGFVFPQFYGDWYKNCALNLACNWGGLSQGKWGASEGIQFNGTYLSDQFIANGITSLKKYEDYLKDIEKDFWDNRFPEYKEWKNRWWATYLKHGYFIMLTGFLCGGVMGKKEVCCYPAQGSSFHCLLWTFIETDKLIQRKKLRSRLLGQIHDSMIACVNPEETEYLQKAINKIATVELPEAWEWINVPLQVDFTVNGINSSWADK
jgi:DNA polymerase I-like protein with 3'-5' exonuclease and polymerase domains